MATEEKKLTGAWLAAGDGSKQVLIEVRSGAVCWCDNATPTANGPYHYLGAGQEILLPAGMKPQIRADDGVSAVAIVTVYP